MRKTNARLEGILARRMTLKTVALFGKELSSGQWETNKEGKLLVRNINGQFASK